MYLRDVKIVGVDLLLHLNNANLAYPSWINLEARWDCEKEVGKTFGSEKVPRKSFGRFWSFSSRYSGILPTGVVPLQGR